MTEVRVEARSPRGRSKAEFLAKTIAVTVSSLIPYATGPRGNPNFFKGTAVESQVQKFRAEEG
jgi:hypothetical protein